MSGNQNLLFQVSFNRLRAPVSKLFPFGPRAIYTVLMHAEKRTRQQFVNKTRRFWGVFRGCENRKSKAGKRFLVCDLIIDTVEVWGSSPHGPTIFLSPAYRRSSRCRKRSLPQIVPQTIQLGFGNPRTSDLNLTRLVF